MYAGNVDIEIGELIRFQPGFFARFNQILISRLDSVREIASARIGAAVLRQFPECTAVGHDLLVPARAIGHIDHELGLFFGFDEIWCFEQHIMMPKPSRISILPPPPLGPESIPPEALAWMTASTCTFALADGFGMNFVALNVETATALKHVVSDLP